MNIFTRLRPKISAILDSIAAMLADAASGRLWPVLALVLFLLVILINGVSSVPWGAYQHLAQNPFITRTDMDVHNPWQETVLLPLLAFWLRMNSPNSFAVLCLTIIGIAVAGFAILVRARWRRQEAVLFTAILLNNPVTTILLAWVGSPDGLTFALTIPLLFTDSGAAIFLLAALGALNHVAYVIAGGEILLLRSASDGGRTLTRGLVFGTGSLLGYALLQSFLLVNRIHVMSRLEVVFSRSLLDWVNMNMAHLPLAVLSLLNAEWLIIPVCFIMFLRSDKRFCYAVLGLLALNYAIAFFTEDTTRIFSLLSWGIVMECVFHSYKLASMDERSTDARGRLVTALSAILIISFITPRFYVWAGSVYPAPSSLLAGILAR